MYGSVSAYEVLSDSEKRTNYDMFGCDDSNGASGNTFHTQFNFDEFFNGFDHHFNRHKSSDHGHKFNFHSGGGAFDFDSLFNDVHNDDFVNGFHHFGSDDNVQSSKKRNRFGFSDFFDNDIMEDHEDVFGSPYSFQDIRMNGFHQHQTEGHQHRRSHRTHAGFAHNGTLFVPISNFVYMVFYVWFYEHNKRTA